MTSVDSVPMTDSLNVSRKIVPVEVELAEDVVPEVAVVVERPRVGDVGEADDLAEARDRDEAERDEEEEDVPGDRRKGEPARIAGAAGTGAGLPAPALGRAQPRSTAND